MSLLCASTLRSHSVDKQEHTHLKTLYKKSKALLGTDIKAALSASKQYLNAAKEHHDTAEVANALNNVGLAHYYLNNIDSAVYYGELALSKYEGLNDSAGISEALVNLGLAYSYTNQVDKAFENFTRAYRIDTLRGDPSGAVFYYYNLSTLLAWQLKTEEAEAALIKAYEASKTDTSHNYLLPGIYVDYAVILRERGAFDAARDTLYKAIALSRKFKDSMGVASAYSELSYLDYLNGKYQEALPPINKAIKINEHYGDRYGQSIYYGQKAEIFNAMSLVDSAYRYADSSLAIAKAERSPELLMEAWYIYSQIYEQDGRFEDALSAYKRSYAYNDSIVVLDVNSELLSKQSENSKKKLNDSRLIQQQQESELKYRSRWIVVMVLLVAVSIAFIVFLLLLRKRTQAYNKALLERNQQILEHRAQLDEKTKELEDTNEQLRNINKSKDRLFSVLSHDLRQPFNQLLASIELISSGSLTSDEQSEILNSLRESVLKTSNMVNNMLVWSKAQFAGITIEKRPIELSVFIKKQLLQQSVSIDRKNIEVSLNIEPLEVYFDENHLRIILRNILQNAIKFSQKGGEISLSSKAYSAREALLEICDNGIGMTPEKLNQIREGTNSLSEIGTLDEVGFGLGLLISSQFLNENEGRMEVDSTLNQGSCFRLYLPRPLN